MRLPTDLVGRRGLRALVAVPVLAAVLVVSRGDGFPVSRLSMSAGSVWLASSRVGQLSLIDGASAELVTQVPVAKRSTRLTAVQAGADAYAVNRSAGTVVRVDGRTYATSSAVRLVPGTTTGLQVFPGSGTLFALDGSRGVVHLVDPTSLRVRRPLSLAVEVAEGAGVVDGGDRLWVLDQRTGDLVWLDGTDKRSRPRAAGPARARLVRMGDGVALVDLAARTVQLLDRSGRPSRRGCVDVAAADLSAQVGGSSAGERLYAVSGRRGLLLVSDLRSGDCTTAIPITSQEADLGVPLEAGGRVFVPDFTTGRVLVVDLASQRVVARPRVLDRGEFELLTRDGIVFYNDLDSERAGVVRLDGSVRRIAKYNPSRPGSGVARPPGSARTPPQEGPSDPQDPTPPQTGPSTGPPRTTEQNPVSVVARIRLSPSNQGAVGDLFQFEVVPAAGGGVRSARWTFGDGQSGDGTRITHAWSTAGVFKVFARVVMADGREAVAGPVTMTIGTDGDTTPPVIESLTHNPPDKWLLGTTVTFSAVVTGGEQATWQWTLIRDDGQITATFKDEKPSVRHTFDTFGEYTMHLTVTNSLGSATAETGGIDVLERLPVTPVITSFTRSPQSPTMNQQVTFTAVVADAQRFTFDWVVFREGAFFDSGRDFGLDSFTTTVSDAGDYRVELTVSDTVSSGNDCACDRETDRFTVEPQPAQPPTARLTVSPASGPPPLAVTADASASTADAGIATYSFDFGDGTTTGPQSAPTASHTYQNAGSFQVTVTVTDNDGTDDQATRTVTVENDTTSPTVTLAATNLGVSVSGGSGDRALQVSPGMQIQLQVISNDSGSGIAETSLLMITGSTFCDDPNSEFDRVQQGLSVPVTVSSNQISRTYTVPTCPAGWGISTSGSFSAEATDAAGNATTTGRLTFAYSS